MLLLAVLSRHDFLFRTCSPDVNRHLVEKTKK